MRTCDGRRATCGARCDGRRAVEPATRKRPEQVAPHRAHGTRHRTSHVALRTLHVLAIAIIGGSADLLACPVCFGAEETAMIDGTKLGIAVMLAITFAVQGGFLGFFLYLRRRAKRMAEIDLDTEWSELQGASRTS